MDRGAWQTTVHGVTKSQKALSNYNNNDKINCTAVKKMKMT